jgi:hypothetical protein
MNFVIGTDSTFLQASSNSGAILLEFLPVTVPGTYLSHNGQVSVPPNFSATSNNVTVTITDFTRSGFFKIANGTYTGVFYEHDYYGNPVNPTTLSGKFSMMVN